MVSWNVIDKEKTIYCCPLISEAFEDIFKYIVNSLKKIPFLFFQSVVAIRISWSIYKQTALDCIKYFFDGILFKCLDAGREIPPILRKFHTS